MKITYKTNTLTTAANDCVYGKPETGDVICLGVLPLGGGYTEYHFEDVANGVEFSLIPDLFFQKEGQTIEVIAEVV